MIVFSRYKIIFLFISLIILGSRHCIAQEKEIDDEAEKHISLRKKNKLADEAFEKLDFLRAYTLYEDILAKDSSDMYVYYRAGVCLFKLGENTSTAIRYFQKSSQKINDSHYYLGRIYHFKNDLMQAMKEYNYFEEKYRPESEIPVDEERRWIDICKSSIERMLNALDLQVKPLGANVNTKFPDYAPFLSPDEQMLVFTSRREGSAGNDKDPYERYYEDIFFCKREGDEWSKAKPFSVNINTMTHDAGVTFAPDGGIIFYRTDEKKTGGDLYISHRTTDDWQEAKILTGRINSEYCESSACFSPNGGMIIFSSDKPGGYGGKDLYRIIKFSDSLYSMPLNLGPKINTEYDEDGPFLHGDTLALYFSSKGHNTMGGYDIFKAAYDSSGSFRAPVSLDPPFNSTADDIYYVLTKNGETSYLSSNRSGNFDIYESALNVHNTAILRGRISVEANKIIDMSKVQITINEEPSGKFNGIYKIKKNFSTFIFYADKTKEFKVTIESPEIKTKTEKIKITGDEISLTVKKLGK